MADALPGIPADDLPGMQAQVIAELGEQIPIAAHQQRLRCKRLSRRVLLCELLPAAHALEGVILAGQLHAKPLRTLGVMVSAKHDHDIQYQGGDQPALVLRAPGGQQHAGSDKRGSRPVGIGAPQQRLCRNGQQEDQ